MKIGYKFIPLVMLVIMMWWVMQLKINYPLRGGTSSTFLVSMIR